jgi:hypothetical protein
MKDVLALCQLPELFRGFVVTETNQTTFAIGDLNRASAIQSLCDERSRKLYKSI